MDFPDYDKYDDYEGRGASSPPRLRTSIDRRSSDGALGGALGAMPCWLNLAIIAALVIVIILAVCHLYRCWTGKQHHHSTGYVPGGGKEGFCCGA
jgi:hypothetical protein